MFAAMSKKDQDEQYPVWFWSGQVLFLIFWQFQLKTGYSFLIYHVA